MPCARLHIGYITTHQPAGRPGCPPCSQQLQTQVHRKSLRGCEAETIHNRAVPELAARKEDSFEQMQKLLKDCMTAVGFWEDDAQVCSELVEKRWVRGIRFGGTASGIWIQVREMKA